jgi:hypothetical protein
MRIVRFGSVSVILTMALLAGACSSSGHGSTTGTTAATGNAPASKSPIVIGYVTSLTGPGASTSCTYYLQLQGNRYVTLNGGKPFCGKRIVVPFKGSS